MNSFYYGQQSNYDILDTTYYYNDGLAPMDVDHDVIVIEDDDIKPTEPKTNTNTNTKVASRKKTIPAPIRRKVWNTYIGESNGMGKCMCCADVLITPFMFECGHVISEHDGGTLSIENLRPICSVCNRSMGKKNMELFMIEKLLPKPANWYGYIPPDTNSKKSK